MKRKFTLAIILLLALALPLTACSSNKGKEEASQSPASSASGSPEQASDPFAFPLAEPVTLKIFAQKRAEAGEYNEMQVFQELEKTSNVHVEWTAITASGGLNEKKNLLFASGELPDAFYGRALNEDEVVKYGSQGLLIPLEGLIEKYAPNLLKVFESMPNLKAELTAKDGHIYSLPQILDNGFTDATSTFFINKKWLDQLSLPIPETTDQFVEALQAFKKNDLNGNGKADEMGLGFIFGDLTDGENALAGSFGIVSHNMSDYLFMRDGKSIFVPAQPEYKEFLAYMNGLYKQGLIDPESFTHKKEVYQSKIKGKEAVYGAFIGWSNALYFGDAESEYVAIPPLKGPSGDQLWNRGTPQVFQNGFSITAANKNPEATVKWIDQAYEPRASLEFAYGPFDHNLKENADGSISIAETPEGMNNNSFRHSEAPGAFGVYAVTRDQFNKLEGGRNEKEKREYLEMYSPYLPKEIYPDILFSEEDLGKLEKFKMDINEGFMKTTVAKFIINGFTDADWNQYVDQMKKMGLDQMMEIYQRNYDEFKNVK